ncbi:EAL domain-containing protein [Anaerobacillus alkaliphilus]|uniref:EAL domain-containing protein n=1 Tax=Anaerobacillus alkaliphilus TaxID=1548597 RepID=A0A4Q0VPL3_9BACI|nr:EAL domain-containing protein [Anaerobacillus alkaliphilus]RXI96275.1 EAL domain-containing protein [Anaerobacillus alkaliphilus]
MKELDYQANSNEQKVQPNVEQDLINQILFEQNPDLIAHVNLQGKFVHVNKSFEYGLGYSKEELLGNDFSRLVHPDDIEKVWQQFEIGVKGIAKDYDIVLVHKNKELIYGFITCLPISINSKVVGIIAIVKNVSDKVATQKLLQSSEMKYRSIVENSNLGVFISVEGSLVFTNYQLNDLLGYEQLIHTSLWSYVVLEDRTAILNQVKQLEIGQSEKNIYAKAVHLDGSLLDVELHVSKIIYEGQSAILGTVMDITEKKKLYELNEYFAYHDPLTDLPNRRMFEKELQNQLLLATNSRNSFALIALDLDRFKYINDSLGHEAGSAVLRMVTDRWKQIIPKNSFLARVGGDEFFLIVPGANDTIQEVAISLLTTLHEPFQYNHYEFTVTTSVGITFYPYHGTNANSLIKNADAALYYAKENGKNNYQIFTQSMNEKTEKNFRLENELRQALRYQEFEVFYQPRVDTEGKLISAEALLRWKHKERGFVPPSDFIPIAEETGLIIPIGNLVLNKVCQYIVELKRQGYPVVPISVNISAKQFMQVEFIREIESILHQTEVDTRYLEFEITETLLILDENRARDTLSDIQQLGIRVSLDDFGTGYSSLGYLTQFSHLISAIKIDRSFFFQFNEKNKQIVKMIIRLAQELHLRVVAEGIEKSAQLNFLKNEDCHEIQGYLFSPPVPSNHFLDFVVIGHISTNSESTG